MKKYYFSNVLIIFILFFSLSSCSSKLSREQAEKIIKEKYNLPTDEIIELYVYDATFSQNFTENKFKRLQNEGLLTYSECGEGMARGVCATLTEKGKQYAASSQYKTDNMWIKKMKVKGAKLDFGQITGIVVQKESNITEVQYQIVREVNPFGIIIANLNSGTINKTAIFRKYDDGWRIEN